MPHTTGSQGILAQTSLFGGLGITGNPVKVSDTDAFVLVDGSEAANQAITSSDSVVLLDTGESISVSNIASIDEGKILEAQSLDITLKDDADHKESIALAELGGTAQIEVQVPSSDSGVLVETEAITINFTSTDSIVMKETEVLSFDRRLTITIDSIAPLYSITIEYVGGS